MTMRSSSAAGSVSRSTAPPPGPCSGIPSRRTSDSSAVAPRKESVVAWPGPPNECSDTPGAVLSNSATDRTSPANSSAWTTVASAAGARTEARDPVTSTSTGSACGLGSAVALPVGTASPPRAGALARRRATRNSRHRLVAERARGTVSPLSLEEVDSLLAARQVSWLPGVQRASLRAVPPSPARWPSG